MPKPKYYTRYFTPEGSTKQIKVYGKTAKEAEQKLLQKIMEYKNGAIVANGNTNFATWKEEWLKIYKQPKVTAKSYKDIKGIIDRVFTPKLGHMKLSAIKLIHIQDCLNDLAGKSTSYIRKARNIIVSIFDKAVLNELINRNIALGLEEPRSSAGQRRSLTEEELKLFHQCIDQHPRGLMFALSLACGLRPGEVRALTWFNINLAKKELIITQAIESGSKDVKEPKTSAGKRTIPIPDWLGSKLEALEHTQSPYVFANQYGQPLTETAYRRTWKSFLRQMDLAGGAETYRNAIIIHAVDQNLTPYYLRHTYATKLAEAGIDIKTAQYLLGHADIKMTAQVYTHVTPRMLETAREKINQAT